MKTLCIPDKRRWKEDMGASTWASLIQMSTESTACLLFQFHSDPGPLLQFLKHSYRQPLACWTLLMAGLQQACILSWTIFQDMPIYFEWLSSDSWVIYQRVEVLNHKVLGDLYILFIKADESVCNPTNNFFSVSLLAHVVSTFLI